MILHSKAPRKLARALKLVKVASPFKFTMVTKLVHVHKQLKHVQLARDRLIDASKKRAYFDHDLNASLLSLLPISPAIRLIFTIEVEALSMSSPCELLDLDFQKLRTVDYAGSLPCASGVGQLGSVQRTLPGASWICFCLNSHGEQDSINREG